MKTRIAYPDDIVKVSRLWLKMVEEMMPNTKPSLEWWRLRAGELMTMSNYFMHVAEDGGKLVGFVDYLVFPEPATSKYHGVGQTFYVLPEYRGNGVSGKLWKDTLTNLKKVGASCIDIICADGQKDFWESHGFEKEYSFMKRKEV